ncbi:cytochrome P450 [Colletotrichum karsti]|uniref:Cytochrome P450 n=1 Tax=Colletotrichum karsti TaxID=1095194 RepID=A0A9P6HUL7_9PEZI|nr:cytochrome P450 [Colletotrichum karsti]KAF9870335.1 cytochrome P450 [Colletotrichum karsti]
MAFLNLDFLGHGPQLLLISMLSVVFYALYYYFLPKPIPEIPYNEESRRSFFGDIPKLRKELPHSAFAWMSKQGHGSGSPLFQVWLGPFAKPTVILSDFREGQDIMMRRKEFDRSDAFAHNVGGEAGTFHVTLKTGSEWKAHRRLLQDLMTPAFLNGVAAPQIYKSCQCLLELWTKKAEIADGKAFNAEHDVFHAALDAVLDFGYGGAAKIRALPPQIETIDSLSDRDIQQLRSASAAAIDFPVTPDHPVIKACIQAAENVAGVGATGFPRLAWWVIGWKPSIRSGREARRKFLDDQIFQAINRYKAGEKDQTDKSIKCAIDLMVQREDMAAQKQGKRASNWLQTMRDESLGFLIAGHDTTSTTFCWGLKFLADDYAVQQKLFESLRAAFPAAVEEKRLPTDREITNARVPYLEAVIEEMLRLAHTAPIQDRQATEDTILLGHRIPKGTNVIIPNMGPSFTEPALHIDEHLRSPSSQAAAKEHGVRVWAEKDMHKYNPDRWITPDEKGIDEFNAAAGPTSPFGLGLRGCFGRKLSYMELRLLTTLLVWNFELQQCPASLSSYDSTEALTRKPVQCYLKLKRREM